MRLLVQVNLRLLSLGLLLASASIPVVHGRLEADATLPAMRMARLRDATAQVDPVLGDRRLLAASDPAASTAEGGDFRAIFDFYPVSARTWVGARHDATSLHVTVRAENPHGGKAKGERAWILLSPGRADDRFVQIQIDASGSIAVLGVPRAPSRSYGVVLHTLAQGERLTPKVTGAVRRAPGGWSAEVTIPFAELGVAAPGKDEVWRLNVIRDRAGIDPISSWFPLLRGYQRIGSQPYWDIMGNLAHSENSYGEIVFEENQAPDFPDPAAIRYVEPGSLKVFLPAARAAEAAGWRWTWFSPDGKAHDATVAPVEEGLHLRHPPAARPGRHSLEATDSGGRVRLVLHLEREALIRAGSALLRSLPAGNAPRPRVAWLPLAGEAKVLYDMLPPSNGFWSAASPLAKDARRDRNTGNFRWSADDPHHIVCVQSGAVFPDPEKHPPDGVTVFLNQRGEPVEFPYILRADGVKCYVEPHLWSFQLQYIVRRLPDLAAKDPAGAARVLHALAQLHERFVVMFDQDWAPSAVIEDIGSPWRQMGNSMWARWAEHNELSLVVRLAEVLVTLRKTDALTRLSEEVGEDVDARIEFGMLRASAEHVRSFPIQNHNIDGYGYAHLIALGKILGEPDYLHDVLERTENLASEFFVDGFFNEITLSYHRQTLNRSIDTVARALNDWSDPDGWISPRSGHRLDHYDLRRDLLETHPHLARAFSLSREIIYPDGRSLPVQDTWASDRMQPRTSAAPRFFPGSKLARLERSSTVGQAQAWLLAQPKFTGHIHADALNLAIFDHGRELVPLLGYDRSAIRSWSQSTLAQNTVVVDGANVAEGNVRRGGNLQLFAPVSPGLQIVRMAQPNVLPRVVSRFERELWMVARPDGRTYYVDLFRVVGGRRHEYTLNGEALHRATFTTDLPLQPYNDVLLPPGTRYREPANRNDRGDAGGHYPAYLFVRDVQSAPLANGSYTLTQSVFRTDVQGKRFVDTGQPLAGYRLKGFVEGEGESTLFLGKVPSLRPARWSRDMRDSLWGNPAEPWKHWMPKMVLRRQGQNLESTFISVIEPQAVGDRPPQTEILRIREPGLIGLQLRNGASEDILLSADDPAQEYEIGTVRFSGQAGFVRRENGRTIALALVGGTVLADGETRLTGSGVATGEVLATCRMADGDVHDAVVVRGAASKGWIGATLVVEHPDKERQGFTIRDVRPGPDPESTAIVIEYDPGFVLPPNGAAAKVFFPFTRWKAGTHRYYVYPHEQWRAATGR